MTLRDYFAARALPSIIRAYVDACDYPLSRLYDEIAFEAYAISDAMIEARKEVKS